MYSLPRLNTAQIIGLLLLSAVYVYMYICMCVCVCASSLLYLNRLIATAHCKENTPHPPRVWPKDRGVGGSDNPYLPTF